MTRQNDPLYNSYHNIKRRCKGGGNGGPAYKAKNVKLCEAWSSFEAFAKWALVNGYATGLVIHRLDNDGDYEPCNCVYVTKSEHTKIHNKIREQQGSRNKLGQWTS